MGARSQIEWTDSTWNPIRGCSRVSEGCRNCYAEAVAARFSGKGQAYEGLAVMHNHKPQWTGEVRLIERHLRDPLVWKEPRKIFVNSTSDLFHEKVPSHWLHRIFAVMALSGRHTFQILTKRPERMLEYCREPSAGLSYWIGRFVGRTPEARLQGFNLQDDIQAREKWPLRNVWLGVSVEDQATADARIPLLLQTPAAVRFISYEPALGPVDFRRWLFCEVCGYSKRDRSLDHDHHLCRQQERLQPPYTSLDWIIAGGESGPHARPSRPTWFQDVRDQCRHAGVPFFFKQWGRYVRGPAGRLAVQGRLLDNREWSEFPEVTR